LKSGKSESGLSTASKLIREGPSSRHELFEFGISIIHSSNIPFCHALFRFCGFSSAQRFRQNRVQNLNRPLVQHDQMPPTYADCCGRVERAFPAMNTSRTDLPLASRNVMATRRRINRCGARCNSIHADPVSVPVTPRWPSWLNIPNSTAVIRNFGGQKAKAVCRIWLGSSCGTSCLTESF